MPISPTALTVCLYPKPVFSVTFLSYAHSSVQHHFLKVPCSPEARCIAYSRDLRWTKGTEEKLGLCMKRWCAAAARRIMAAGTFVVTICNSVFAIFFICIFPGKKNCSWLVRSFTTGCYAMHGYSIAWQWTTWEYQNTRRTSHKSLLEHLGLKPNNRHRLPSTEYHKDMST